MGVERKGGKTSGSDSYDDNTDDDDQDGGEMMPILTGSFWTLWNAADSASLG